MKILQYAKIFLAVISIFMMQAVDAERHHTSPSSDVPEVFPTETRDNKVWKQDDHIHTRPDAVETRFELLDVDDDRRLQWDETQAADMERHIFRTLDTDGSGDLDREEYIAVSPSPENQYTEGTMAEP